MEVELDTIVIKMIEIHLAAIETTYIDSNDCTSVHLRLSVRELREHLQTMREEAEALG